MRRNDSFFVCSLLTLALLLAAVSVHAQDRQDYVPGEVIVQYKASSKPGTLQELPSRINAQKISTLKLPRTHLYRVDQMNVEEAVAAFEQDPNVEFAEPNYLWDPVAIPNDISFNQQWGHQNTGQTGGTPGADIGSTRAWDITTGGGILVGIIDTGTDFDHQDLIENMWVNPDEIPGDGIDNDNNGYIDDIYGWDFANNDNDPSNPGFQAMAWHGTHVAGIVGQRGNNSLGGTGVCWDVKLLALKASADHSQNSGLNSVAIIDAIDYAIEKGVHVLNASYGQNVFSNSAYQAIERASNAGILFVAAAGNDGENNDAIPFYPASYNLPNVISVAASDHNDDKAAWSDYGATTVDLAAPGVGIYSTIPDDQYNNASGTSMASPEVAGALALLLSAEPDLTVQESIDRLFQYVDPVPAWSGLTVTGGRLNIGRMILGEDTTPPDAITTLATGTMSSSWVEVTWLAPADDGFTQRADQYDLRYSTSPIDAGNFNSATPVSNLPVPGPSGTGETARAEGLAYSTNYYFAIKSIDEAGNVSDISNVVACGTLPAPTAAAAPNPITAELVPGGTGDVTFSLWNAGIGGLDYAMADPSEPWATLVFDAANSREGTLFSGDTATVTVHLEASGLPAGLNTADFIITTNDPSQPAITVGIELTVIDAPDVAVSPTDLDFDGVFTGNSRTLVLQISNPGTASLNIAGIGSDNPDFVPEFGSLSVGPGDTQPMEVVYTPSGPGAASGTLSFLTNDPDEQFVYVPLQGEGLDLPTLNPQAVGDTAFAPGLDTHTLTLTNNASVDLTYEIRGAAGSTRFMSLDQGLPDLTGMRVLYPTGHNMTGTTNYLALAVDLLGRGADIVETAEPISAALLAENHFVWLASPDTVWTGDEKTALKDWVEGGGSLLLTTGYFPSDFLNDLMTSFGANITFSSDPQVGGVTDDLGIHEMTSGLTAVDVGGTLTYLSKVDFPSATLVTDAGGLANAAFAQIGNGRLVTLVGDLFSQQHINSQDNFLFAKQIFSWLGDGVWLAADPTGGTAPGSATTDITVTIDSNRIYNGYYNGDVIVRITAPDELEFVVPAVLWTGGYPGFSASTDTVEVGPVFLGYPETATFVVENTGMNRLDVVWSILDNPEFTIDPPTFKLWPSQGQIVTVTFAPTQVGPRTGILNLYTNDYQNPQVTLMLLGEGVDPPEVVVTPASISDQLTAGFSSTHNLSIANTGASDLDWSLQLVGDAGSQKGTEIGVLGAAAVDLSEVRVLYDESHGQGSLEGNWSSVRSAIEIRGGTVDANAAALTPELLGQYDVFWSTHLGSAIAKEEEEALVSWVLAGGSLLLEADNDLSVSEFNVILTRLGAGIQMDAGDGVGGVVTDFEPHWITEGITEISVASPEAHIASVTGAGGILVRDGAANTNTAYSETGAARILVMASENFSNSVLYQSDNFDFCLQAFDWLGGLNWIRLSAESGTVPAGGVGDVTVTLDAEQVLPATLSVSIVVSSNDPATQSVSVPVSLEILAAPDIKLMITSLDYGEVFLDDTATLAVPVTNIGSSLLNVTLASVSHASFTVDPVTFTVAPRETVDVNVFYTPTSVETVNTTLSVDSNDPVDPTVQVSIAAQGVIPPDVGVDTTPITVSLDPGQYTSVPLSFDNLGGSNLVWSIAFDSAEPAVGSPIRILRDLSHGQISSANWTKITSDLIGRGAEITENLDQEITPALLAGYDVFWMTNSMSAEWISAEKTALKDWVAAGGGLFLHNLPFKACKKNCPPDWEQYEIDNLALFKDLLGSMASGIVMDAEDATDGLATFIAQHRTTLDVNSFRLTGAWARLSSVSAPGMTLLTGPGGVDAGALADIGSGRVLVFSGDYINDSRVTQAGNRRLASQLFDWMAGERWVSAYRANGTLAAGGTKITSIGFFSESLGIGDHPADLLLNSNDPIDPQVVIPLILHVNGIPDIQVPVSINFGNTFTGYTVVRQATVSNVGTDVLNLTAITFDGSFSWGGPGAFQPGPLNPGQNLVFNVNFTPSYEGFHMGSMAVHSDDPDEPETHTGLRGTGIDEPEIHMEPSGAPVLGMKGADLTINNRGKSDLRWRIRIGEPSGSALIPYSFVATPGGDAASLIEGPAATQGSVERIYLADLQGIRVAYAEGGDPSGSHQTLARDLLLRGATMELLQGSLDLEVLEEFDVLWLAGAWSESDGSIAEAWARDGGALLLEGARLPVAPTEIANLMPLGEGWEAPQIVSPPQGVEPSFGEWMLIGTGRVVSFSKGETGDKALEDSRARVSVNRALDWLTPQKWLVAQIVTGSIEPDGTATIHLDVVADDLQAGTHETNVLVHSNDPDQPLVTVPVRFTVTAEDLPAGRLPSVHALLQNAPNPFGSTTTIRFDLPDADDVRLQVFDLSGRLVQTLLNQEMPAGSHELMWNGRDGSGRRVVPGIYFYRMTTGKFNAVKKMLLIR